MTDAHSIYFTYDRERDLWTFWCFGCGAAGPLRGTPAEAEDDGAVHLLGIRSLAQE